MYPDTGGPVVICYSHNIERQVGKPLLPVGSNPQPPAHEADALTTRSPWRYQKPLGHRGGTKNVYSDGSCFWKTYKLCGKRRKSHILTVTSSIFPYPIFPYSLNFKLGISNEPFPKQALDFTCLQYI